MKLKVLALLLLPLGLFGQCSFNAPVFTAAGTSVPYDNRTKGCYQWIVTFWVTGLTGTSFQLEGAPDNAGVPGSWSALTPVSGYSNPSTSSTFAAILVQANPPWVRVNLTAATGVGKLTFQTFGTSGISQALNGTGGGGGGGTCAALGGDLSGTCTAANVVKINNAAVAASQNPVSTNSAGQLVAAVVQGNGTKVQLSTGVSTTNDCVKFDANGNTIDSGAACGAASTVPFSGITSGTNTTAAMLMGAGASLGPTSTGTITATQVPTGAGATAATNGQLKYDTTNNNLHAANNSGDAIIPVTTVTPGNGNCANWSVSSGILKLGDAGSACGSSSGGGGGVVTYSGPTLSILSGTAYCPVGGGGSCSATETNVDIDSSAATTVSNMYVQLSPALGSGNSVVVTWRDNATSKAVTCTISGASATSCNDTTHSFNVANGDLIDYQLVFSGTIIVIPTITIMSAFGTSNVGVTSVFGNSGPTVGATGDINATGRVVGINSVPLCTGFTPTTLQFLQYTTASSPNPCYTAATPSAGTSTAPYAFASIPACSTTKAFYQITNSLITSAYCNGSSTLSYFLGGWQVTPPTGFAWQNQSTATLTTANGGELLLSAVGATGNNINGRYVAYPTPPFIRTLTARIKSYTVNGHVAANGYGGIYLSDGTKAIVYGPSGVGYGSSIAYPVLNVQYGPTLTNITTQVTTGGAMIVPADINYLRFGDGYKCDGSTASTGNRYYCYSYDNVNFIQFYTETNTTNLTATQMGYFAQGYDTGTYTMLWALGWQ